MEVNLIVKNVVTWDITITQGLMFGLSLNGVDSSIISRGRVLYNITVLQQANVNVTDPSQVIEDLTVKR